MNDSFFFTFETPNGPPKTCDWITLNSLKVTICQEYCNSNPEVKANCCVACSLTVGQTETTLVIFLPTKSPTAACVDDSSFTFDTTFRLSQSYAWITQSPKRLSEHLKWCNEPDMSSNCCLACSATSAPMPSPQTSPPTNSPIIACVDDSSFIFATTYGQKNDCAWITLNNVSKHAEWCYDPKISSNCCATSCSAYCKDNSLFSTFGLKRSVPGS